MRDGPASAKPPDYTVDLVYPSGFGAFQAPIHLSYAASTAGYRAPDPGGAFRYCDLGCGAGLTLCVLAECYPEAEFHGVDINPEHIRRGRDLAAAAGLSNVVFHETSFARLGEIGPGEFDYIGLSGVYSWLPPGLREACMRFAGERLSASGVVFLHYGALPGNSQVDALYGLLREVAASGEGDSLARYRHAVAVLEKLRAAKARFFAMNPYAEAWFRQLEHEDPRAMAHEVLNAQRASLSVRDAADETAPHGLALVADAQLELNYLDLVAPDALRADLERLSTVARAMTLDALRNAQSRMDVLMRRSAPRDPDALAGFLVGRITRGSLSEERRNLAGRTGVPFDSAIYEAVLKQVDGEARGVAELSRSPALASFAPAEVLRAVERLVAVKLLSVLSRPYGSAAAADGAIAIPSTLNRLILDDQIEAAGQLPFASPVAGTQVLLPMADRLALLAWIGGDFEAAWSRIEARGGRIRHEGRPVAGAADLAEVAGLRARSIRASAVPALLQLGIVRPASPS